MQTFSMKLPTADTTTKLRCDVRGSQGFLFSHEQLLAEWLGGDNVMYMTQNHRYFFTRKEFLW